MKFILLYLSICFVSFNVCAENGEKVLTFNYWAEAGPPFVILSDDSKQSISSGILKDLADLIARRLNTSPLFINIPVRRTDSQLGSGSIDINCLTNPIWKDNPDAYDWSPPLFKGADRFLVRKSDEHEFATFADLKGKKLGVYNGYIYQEKIMDMIKSGDIDAVKVSGIDHGIKLLLLDRIDLLIDFDTLLNFKIKTSYSDQLALADLVAETYDLYCAYSKKTTFDINQLNDALTGLVENGEIKAILSQY